MIKRRILVDQFESGDEVLSQFDPLNFIPVIDPLVIKLLTHSIKSDLVILSKYNL